MLGVRIDFRIDIYSAFCVEKVSFWKQIIRFLGEWIYSENYFLTGENRVRDNLFYYIIIIYQKWRVLEKQKIEFMRTCNILNGFFMQYCIFYLFWIFLFSWSILKILGKSGYFRYLFLRFIISSLLGESFDDPCWELRIDLSKSYIHKMIWFVEKMGYFCLGGL